MSIVNYLVINPSSSYITPSATSSVEDTGFLVINGSTIRITNERKPSTSTSSGIKGEICIGHETLLGIDTYYIYLCIGTNLWVRNQFTGF